MSDWKSVNLNQNVRFKLNDIGRAAHKKAFEEKHKLIPSLEYAPLKEDSEGWITLPVWDFMKEIGPLIVFGFRCPVETEIEIDFHS